MLVALCSANQWRKLFETDHLSAAPNEADKLKMDVPKGYGTKDKSGPSSSANPPI